MEAADDVSIVDVRTPEEYAGEHFPNAINIPLDEVAQRTEDFRKMKKPIIAYCITGSRSGTAVSVLKQNGIADTINGGGLNDLKQSIK